jgi:dimethylargininase
MTHPPRIPFLRKLIAAVTTAAAVALATHGATLFFYAVANTFTADSLSQTNTYFIPSSLLLFFILFALGLLGSFRLWYTALATAVGATLLAALLGTLLTASAAGSAIAPAIVIPLLATLMGLNLAFVVSGIIATYALGRRFWRFATTTTVFGSGFGGAAKSTFVLIRQPSDTLADGQITHITRSTIDLELADEQWENYVAALAEAGWNTVEVDPAPTLPDAVFIEDTVVMFGERAVITSPGAETRREEIVAVERTVRELISTVARIELPGTLDGGDVLKVGTTVYVGRGGRTNAEGIRQLRSIVSAWGYTLVAVPVTKVLHLKSAVTALPDGTVIGYLPLVDDVSIFDRFLAVPEETGVAVLVLSADTVLMAASAPKSVALVEDLGYRVVTVDISEFEKLEGCVTCLSVRVR